MEIQNDLTYWKDNLDVYQYDKPIKTSISKVNNNGFIRSCICGFTLVKIGPIC